MRGGERVARLQATNSTDLQERAAVLCRIPRVLLGVLIRTCLRLCHHETISSRQLPAALQAFAVILAACVVGLSAPVHCQRRMTTRERCAAEPQAAYVVFAEEEYTVAIVPALLRRHNPIASLSSRQKRNVFAKYAGSTLFRVSQSQYQGGGQCSDVEG